MTLFNKSRLSVRGFCARERLSEASFYFWRGVIRERDYERLLQPYFPPPTPMVHHPSLAPDLADVGHQFPPLEGLGREADVCDIRGMEPQWGITKSCG
jgi:hypothetical protein